MHREREIRILADAASIAKRAAEEFVEAAAAAVRQRNAFRVVLAGGSTPKALYELLASDPALREQVPWGKTQVFFGDERDRKSTRLNSSHVAISYAVFCLKKKKTTQELGLTVPPRDSPSV